MGKELPYWVRAFGGLSILIFLVLTIYSTTIVLGVDKGEEIFLFPVYIMPLFFTIIILWALGFLFQYLINRGKSGIANTISVIGLIGMIGWYIFYWLKPETLIQIKEVAFWPIIQHIGFVVSIVYFIVALIFVNRSKKILILNQ